MKRSEATGRLHWPREGAAIRVPPRRLGMSAASAGADGSGRGTASGAGRDAVRDSASPSAICEVIAFSGTQAQPARAVAWDALATALPRGTRVVLLVAAEDVSFTTADVPPLSGMRLREALPNLVEEKTVGEVSALHVALGEDEGQGGARMLAVIDRHWLAAMQVDVLRAGHRVAAIIPESLAVPLAEGAWSLAGVGASASPGASARLWLRSAAQQAIPLPDDAASAVATVAALLRQTTGTGPRQLDLYATSAAKADAKRIGEAIASSYAQSSLRSSADSLAHSNAPSAANSNARPAPHPSAQSAARSSAQPAALALNEAGGDPFIEWLARRGHEGAYGAPLSLLAFDAGQGGKAEWARWRIAAALVLAIFAVQIAGMQWRWAQLKREASALRDGETRSLTTAFPDTRVVLDAPLQMSRNLAALRASSGRSDPADFSMMMAASARIFAGLPSNALRATEYDARTLRLRFAPGMAASSDERERLVAQASQEGYVLRFETGQGGASVQGSPSAGESVATLKTKAGA